jgi:hypothetical protein
MPGTRAYESEYLLTRDTETSLHPEIYNISTQKKIISNLFMHNIKFRWSFKQGQPA